jgi:hypothetical protein
VASSGIVVSLVPFSSCNAISRYFNATLGLLILQKQIRLQWSSLLFVVARVVVERQNLKFVVFTDLFQGQNHSFRLLQCFEALF